MFEEIISKCKLQVRQECQFFGALMLFASIKETKKYKKPNDLEKKALIQLLKILENCNENMTPEEIQTKIYTAGKENGYKEKLRDWFKLIYEVVFGVEDGPRIGFFISFFGLKETIKLIEGKLKDV